jgi:hypothetical protein
MRFLPGLLWSVCVLGQLSAAGADPRTEIDVAALDATLVRVVSGGRVDYEGLRRDHARLDAYLSSIANASPTGPADYINAYNAYVIAEQMSAEPGSRTFMNSAARTVFGKKQSPQDLYFSIVAGDDLRVHFALATGRLGEPPLDPRALSTKTLDADLDRLTRSYLDGPGLAVDEKTKEVQLARLFKTHESKFGYDGALLKVFLEKHVSDKAKKSKLAQALAKGSGWKITHREVDPTPNAVGFVGFVSAVSPGSGGCELTLNKGIGDLKDGDKGKIYPHGVAFVVSKVDVARSKAKVSEACGTNWNRPFTIDR